MPAGKYTINNSANCKTSGNDQSYRNCITAMLIFLFLCIILIVASQPWKHFTGHSQPAADDKILTFSASYKAENKSEEVGDGDSEMISNSTESSDVNRMGRYEAEGSTTNGIEISSETSGTSAPTTIPSFGSSSSTKMLFENTLNPSSPSETDIFIDSTTSKDVTLLTSTPRMESSTTPTPEDSSSSSSSDDMKTTTSIEAFASTPSTLETSSSEPTDFSKDISNGTQRKSYESNTSLRGLLVAKYFRNESALTTEVFDDDFFFEDDPVTESIDQKSLINTLQSTASSTENFSKETTTPIAETKLTTEDSNRLMRDQGTDEEADVLREDLDVCLSGNCKQFTSKIMSFMNHSADPCEDFYEFSCGNFEADPQILGRDLNQVALQRLLKQMMKLKKEKYSNLNEYFDSCVNYQKLSEQGKIAEVKKMLKIVTKSNENPINDLIVLSIIYDNPLIFDIVPDIDEDDSNKFILSLRPPRRLVKSFEDDSCIGNNLSSKVIDLEELYNDYKSCKFRESFETIVEALKEFDNDHQLIQNDFLKLIDATIMNNSRSEGEIRGAYKFRNNTKKTIAELQYHFTFIDWQELIESITGLKIDLTDKIQIYFIDEMFNMLRVLDRAEDKVALYTTLKYLHIRNFYIELTSNRRRDHCLLTITHLLPLESSNVYLSSFSQDELSSINSTISTIFTELKTTLKLAFENAKWASDSDRLRLINKLSNINISFPSVVDHTIVNYSLTNDFIDNTFFLKRNYRIEMYNYLRQVPNQQLWTYFSKPFETSGHVLYNLNVILIPLGTIETSIYTNYKNFNYLLLSTVGTTVAHELAHYFNLNGIDYWDGKRDAKSLQDSTKINYDEYINCQRFALFTNPIDIYYPITDQTIRFNIPSLSLNERLSDVTGIKLAYDTLVRLRSNSTKLIPWLNLTTHQLFYLAYAQKYCSKAPLLDSYISLYEEPILPNRLRIFVAAKNNNNLGKVWNCREGSQVLSEISCGVFPYIESLINYSNDNNMRSA